MSLSLPEPATVTPNGDGLSSAEATRRLAQFGANAGVDERVHPALQVLQHFWAPVPWMLEIAIVLQIAIGERIEALMIATLLVVNVALGIFQESRASAALALLKERLSLTVRVKRDGAWRDAPAAELVPGDVVQLSLGTIVPADLRVTLGLLLLDQSMLTGESLPADAGPGNTAYAGALVRRGAARRIAIPGRAPDHGHRRYRGHRGDDRPRHRPRRSRLPGRQNPRQRRWCWGRGW